MRTIKLYTLSAAAGLLLAGVAHADDSALFARGGYAGQSTHRSIDAPRGLVRDAEPHWTSRIGAGTVTAFEARKVTPESANNVRVPEGAARYPAPYWASLIGTGTAAKLNGARAEVAPKSAAKQRGSLTRTRSPVVTHGK
jgi:hypothetical protein